MSALHLDATATASSLTCSISGREVCQEYPHYFSMLLSAAGVVCFVKMWGVVLNAEGATLIEGCSVHGLRSLKAVLRFKISQHVCSQPSRGCWEVRPAHRAHEWGQR